MISDKHRLNMIIDRNGKCLFITEFTCTSCPIQSQCNFNSNKVFGIAEKIKARVDTAKSKLAEIEIEDLLSNL